MLLAQMTDQLRPHEHDSNAGLGLRVDGSDQLNDLTNINFVPRGHAPANDLMDPNDENWCPSGATEQHYSVSGESFGQQVFKQCRGPNAAVFLSNSSSNNPLQPDHRGVFNSTPGSQSSRPHSAADELSHYSREAPQTGFREHSSLIASPAVTPGVERLSLCASEPLGPPVASRSPTNSRRGFKSYPTSPSLRQRMVPTNHPSAGLVSRSVNSKPMLAHRASHSLGQVGSFAPLIIDSCVTGYSHASAPGSPAEKLSQHAFAAFLQFPAQRQSIAHLVSDQPAFFSGLVSHDRHARASSVLPASPSNSMTSASFSSVSPMGSTRLNPDGSFTSQDASFDSLSNATSEPLSRASSSFDELHQSETGSLGLPSALRIAKPKVRLRNIDRKLICDYSHAHPNAKQDVIASQFGIERSTVSKILKQKEKWRAIDPESDLARIAKHRAVKFPAIEERLTSWVGRLKSEGTVIKDTMIRKEALSIAGELGVAEDKFKASGGWIEKFRERQSLPKVAARCDHSSNNGSPVSTDQSTIQPDHLMLRTLVSWDSTPSQGGALLAESPASSAQTQAETSLKRPRLELTTVPSASTRSSLHNDAARMQISTDRNHASVFKAATHPGAIDNPIEDAQAMTMLNAGLDTDIERDSKAAAFYAMDVPIDPSPSKRRRTEPTCDRQRNNCFENDFVSALSDNPTTVDPGHPMPKSSHSPQDVLRPSASSLSATNASNNDNRRGRSRRASAQEPTQKRHRLQTPSPLRSSGPDFQALSASSAAGVSTGGNSVPAALGERLDRMKHEDPMAVSPGQAQQSLDLVLRFLNDQPRTFLPSDHLVAIGNLQANIEQLVRVDSPVNSKTGGIDSCSRTDTTQSG